MDIPSSKKTRSQLKSFFIKNAIPTEGNFADLIEAGVNQREDGLVKTPGSPLSIEAGGNDTSQKRALSLYRNFSDPQPACVLSLNPFADPANPATAVDGLGIGDATGKTRLFIDAATGHIGVGTVTPKAGLHVHDGAIMPSAGNSENAGILFSRDPFGGGGDRAWLRYYERSGEVTTLELGIANDSSNHIALMPSGNVGIGINAPEDQLHVHNGDIRIAGGEDRRLRIISDTSWAGIELVARSNGHPHIDFTKGDLDSPNYGVRLYAPDNNTLRLDGGSLDVPDGIIQDHWVTPIENALLWGWKNRGSDYNRFSYFKDRFGIVHLRGVVKDGTIGKSIFVLPEDYYPLNQEIHAVCTYNNTIGRIDITDEGNIQVMAGSPTWISLDGITFRAKYKNQWGISL